MNEKHLFSNTDIRKLLLPIMVEQLLASLMGMVDTIMVSNVAISLSSAAEVIAYPVPFRAVPVIMQSGATFLQASVP